jgi:TorA maturation chaperone TorD
MEDALDKACQRANSYKLLSECYHLPDSALLQKIVEVAQTDNFFAELKACITSDLGLESLKVDYTRLFVGPFKLLAPPYGSVYLEDNRVMGVSTLDVRSCYESESMDIVIKEAPDHIAVELEFMYYLVVKQIEATKEEDPRITEFTENVQENAQTEFYKTLAGLTEMFVQKDAETLAHYGVLGSRSQWESN